MSRPKVVVAISGGVDSSTAASILVEEGYEVVGAFMRLWDCGLQPSRRAPSCCSRRDLQDAKMVAEQVGIHLHVLDVVDIFRKVVVEDFVAEYSAGRTPNPCIRCNYRVRFPLLLELAQKVGAELVATGHYARSVWDPKRGYYVLRRGRDSSKDQSYFLFPLTQKVLSRTVFPIGEWTKEEVRRKAKRLGLCVSDKEESQEICFITSGDYREFLRDYLPSLSQEGYIVDQDGNIVGRHSGIFAYTIGQRRGIGIPAGYPLYVTEILPQANLIKVGPESALYSRGLIIKDVVWISGRPPTEGIFKAMVKIRYRHKEAEAMVEDLGDARARITFLTPQRAVTKGQAAVIYLGDEILGGGWIEEGVKDA